MKVGITHGDFNGANYEILIKLFEDTRLTELFTPVIYGSPRIATWYRKAINTPTQFNFIDKVEDARDGVVNLVNVLGTTEPEITPGKSTPQAGEAARAALNVAVNDLKNGKIDVLVTAPVNKNNMQHESFPFPGHTEYLQHELGEGDENEALMILCSDSLRIAVATTHVPVSGVAPLITEELLLKKLRIFNRSLSTDFMLPHPRIAVLSLNPHAGDGGVIGDEDTAIISPVLEKCRAEGILAFGPFPADGFFGSGNYAAYDGIMAMYHDQGLIPFKMLAMERGVNFTAGLPFIRTSPDHGTAYDLAGKNQASPDSLREAIYMAIDLKKNRDLNKELFSNPLPKLYTPSTNNRE